MDLEKEVLEIHERNRKVEADKAWERSWARKLSICAVTYVTACTFLYMIDVPDFYLAGVVPVLGYLLSTLSLSIVRSWWAA